MFVKPFLSTEVGGLMSYGARIADAMRQGGICVGRILNGEKPAEMLVQLPTRFEFIVNLQTAKTLNIEIPAFRAGPRRRGDRVAIFCCPRRGPCEVSVAISALIVAARYSQAPGGPVFFDYGMDTALDYVLYTC